jgi:hypothetical protein
MAFLVEPNDVEGIRLAMECNTLLWGGMLNPIVPISPRIRSNPEVVQSIVGAFEPEHFVVTGDTSVPFRTIYDDLRYFHGLEAFSARCRTCDPYEGLSVLPLLIKHYESSLRVNESDVECHAVVPQDSNISTAFWFGELTPGSELSHDTFIERAKAKPRALDSTLIQDVFRYPILTPILATVAIESRASGGEPYVLVYNEEEVSEVVAAWNTRAVYGPPLIEVPLRLFEDVAPLLQDSITKMNSNLDRGSLRRPYCRIFATASSMSEVNAFVDRNKLGPYSISSCLDFDSLHRPSIDFSSRFWIENQSSSEVLDVRSNRTIRVRVPKLDFLSRHDIPLGSVSAHLEFQEVGTEGNCTLVVPDDVRTLETLWPWKSHAVTRCGSAIVFSTHLFNTDLVFEVPTGQKLIEWWLSRNGLRVVEQSLPGKLAEKIIAMASGPMGVPGLCHRTALKQYSYLVEGRSHEGMVDPGWRPRRAFEACLKNETLGAPPWMANGRAVFERLVEAQALIGGFEIKCQQCGQRNFYRAKDVDETLVCSSCLSEFPLPYASIAKNPVMFRSHGPFAVPRQAMGSFAVSLAVSHLLDINVEASAFMAGAVIAGDSSTHEKTEIDAIVLRRSRGLVSKVDQIFVECKHGDSFGEADFKRAIRLHMKFPSSTICFATLRETLSEQEKSAILKMLSSFTVNRDGVDAAYPLLILTDTELHSCYSVREVWKIKGGRWGNLADQSLWDRSLLQYCNHTQYLYLTDSDRADYPDHAVREAVRHRAAPLPDE